MHRCAVIAAAAAATLAACVGSDSGPAPADAGRSSLVATPAALPADGTTAATLRATVRDVRGAPVAGAVVAFRASGEGSALSAPDAVTAADGTATVRLTSTVVGWSTVSATLSGVEIPEKPSVEFHAWTDVDGVVATDRPVPLAGISVAAGAGDAWTWRTTTDAAGRFSLQRVRVPYDLVAVHPDGERAVIYVGLTRPDPRASLPGDVRITSAVQYAYPAVTVTCSAGGCPGSGKVFAYAGVGTVGTYASLGSTSVPASWVGGESAVVRVGALSAWLGDEFAGHDWWYATSEVSVAAGETPAVALALAPATSPPLTVTVSSVAGVEPRDAVLVVRYGNGGIYESWWAQAWSQAATNGELTAALPVGDGISPRLFVTGDVTGGWSSAWWEGSPTAATSVALELPAPPVLVAPAEGAADVVPGTEFVWTSPEPVSAVIVNCGNTGVEAFTGGAPFELPDLAGLGLSWPPGSACAWTVRASSNPDVNDAASPAGPGIGVGRVGVAPERAFVLR